MLIQFEELAAEGELPQAKDYLVYPWLNAGRFTLIVGPTNVGKTTLTMEIIAACLKGEHLFGRYPVKKIDKIAYIHGEHTIEAVKEIAVIRGDIPSDHAKIAHGSHKFIVNGEATPEFNCIASMIVEMKPQLIVVEPISAFVEITEDNNLTARRLVSFFCELGEKLNAAILAHHHVGKSFHDKERPKDLTLPTGIARGAQAWEDSAETVIYLARGTDVADEESGAFNARVKITTPKTKGYQIDPITVALDHDTLKFKALTLPAEGADLVAVYNRRRNNPDESIRDLYEHYKKLNKKGSTYVSTLIKRAKRVGLLDADGKAIL